MKRWWSHILLFALLVVSPISFTSADIPSVYISVTINAPLQESRKNRITVAHRIAKLPPSVAVFRPPDSSIPSIPFLPAISTSHKIEHGRAPPVVPSA